jgi:D-sedoheptulose 7-phosphate isomerase
VAGNGSSTADAQHFAAELVGRFQLERKVYPSVSLTTDTSILTTISNDYGFEKIFSKQIEAGGQLGDCFLGISTSANSPNILSAFESSSNLGIKQSYCQGGTEVKQKIWLIYP